jgi:hypothetical protein
MSAEPAAIPPTTPEASTVATAGKLLLHVPPVVALLSVVVSPSHTCSTPVVVAGSGFTVTVVVIRQPVGIVYVISAVPSDKPVTTPVAASTLTVASALLHVPPASASAIVVVEFTHTAIVPVIADGSGFTFTVTALVAWQPALVVDTTL